MDRAKMEQIRQWVRSELDRCTAFCRRRRRPGQRGEWAYAGERL